MDEQDKLNFGLAVSSVIAIVGVALKILSRRISRSSCFGVNVEMENVSQQVQELQRVVAELTQQNTQLKTELADNRRLSNSEMC